MVSAPNVPTRKEDVNTNILYIWQLLVCWSTRATAVENYGLEIRRYSFITKEVELKKTHSGIFSLISVSLWLLAHILESFWKLRFDFEKLDVACNA